MEYGACLNQQDYQGKTPLILALENGCLESFACLLCYNPDLHIRTSSGATALHFAARFNTIVPQFQAFTVRKLLRRGVNPNVQDMNGDTPLHIAARTCTTCEAIIHLFRHGANGTPLNKNGVTAFFDYLSNEKLFPAHLPNYAKLIRMMLFDETNANRGYRAFIERLPCDRPRMIRDALNQFPMILQRLGDLPRFKKVIEHFGTTSLPEKLQQQCVRTIQRSIGIPQLVDSSITVWRLGMPNLLQDMICSDEFRLAMTIPIERHAISTNIATSAT